MNVAQDDYLYMQKALDLARQALGRTEPNPMVGAVIVNNEGIIIGEGYHQKAGTPHAEIHALRQAGENARGATLYVSLEPCSHYGRTPPCTEAVIKAGLKRVVVAMQDPNPKVAGRGIERLKQAGIEVHTGILEAEAIKLNEVFLKHIQSQMPFIASKTAMTLDGKIASVSGDSRWITNEASRKYVHQLRNQYQAIMVGIGTVLADDPLLNTRLEINDSRDPIRVIVDASLEIPEHSQIVKTASRQETIVYCGSQSDPVKRSLLEKMGLKVISVAEEKDFLSLEAIFSSLYEQGICSVLVEGGSTLNGSLLYEGYLDRVYCFIAPKLIGGKYAPGPFGGKGMEKMKDAILLQDMEICHFNEDIMITGRPIYPARNAE